MSEGGKKCRWDSRNSRRCETGIISNGNQENPNVCLLHGSSCGNKWFPHTPAVITSTQQAETAEHSATLRAQCVSWTSVWQRTLQKNTLLMSTRGCWGATLKPSTVTSARKEPTCVNIGHKRVDPNYARVKARIEVSFHSVIWSVGTNETKPSWAKWKRYHSCVSDVAFPQGVKVTISLWTTVSDTIERTAPRTVVMAT